MKNTRKNRIVTVVLAIAMLVSCFTGISVPTAHAAVTPDGVIDGPNEIGQTDSYTGYYSKGQFTISITDDVLLIQSATSMDVFYDYYGQSAVVDEAVVNAQDALVHILGLAGEYWVWDLDKGIYITAYRNMSNGIYCSSRNSMGYMVVGKTAIDSKYFWESFDGSRTRERWMTRKEFDTIVNGGDPSIVTPTATPVRPTATPAVPTIKPLPTPVIPTLAPMPTYQPVVPTQTPNITFDFEFWWQKYIAGQITWEQFTQVTGQANWQIKTEYGEKETTYYFYDDKGNLIRSEKVTTGQKVENGTGNSNVNIGNNGNANVNVGESGQGGGSGSAVVNVPTTGGTTVKDKKYWHEIHTTGHVKLTRSIAGQTAVVCSVRFKKKEAIYDGIKYKNVKDVTYCRKSHMILILYRNGKAGVICRAKGKINSMYTQKYLKGKWKRIIRGTNGLGKRLANGNKVRGIENAQPKKIK